MSDLQSIARRHYAIKALPSELQRYYRAFFVFAGLWNIVLTLAALAMVGIDDELYSLVGLETPQTAFPYWALLPQITLFGVGYFLLSRDLAVNHDILWLGAAGKTVFFIAVLYHYLEGVLNFYPLLVLLLDMVQVAMFIEFLLRVERTARRLDPGLLESSPTRLRKLE